MRRLTLILTISLLSLIGLEAQEKALLYSHYSFNGLALNPAYAGSHEMLSVNLSHRSQWMGFEGAPSYNIFAVHTPLKKTAMGVGLLVMNESIGLRKYTGFYLNYAHRVTLGRGKLALGLKAGLASGKFDVSGLEGDDDVFTNKSSSYLLPNFGAGVYYYTHNFYVGLSVPLMLGYRTNGSGKITAYHDFSKYTWTMTAGITMRVADHWSLQPSALVEYEKASGLLADGGLSVLYQDLLRVGCSYRTKQALVMIMDYKLNYQLHVGLAYDYGMNGINEYNRNSFEIVLEFNFGYQVKASNPTQF
jgi:type IX secretion system PorP/SprF family membrane protein